MSSRRVRVAFSACIAALGEIGSLAGNVISSESSTAAWYVARLRAGSDFAPGRAALAPGRAVGFAAARVAVFDVALAVARGDDFAFGAAPPDFAVADFFIAGPAFAGFAGARAEVFAFGALAADFIVFAFAVVRADGFAVVVPDRFRAAPAAGDEERVVVRMRGLLPCRAISA